MSTLDNVLNAIDAIPHTQRTRYKDGYKLNDPFNPQSDSHSFCIFDIRYKVLRGPTYLSLKPYPNIRRLHNLVESQDMLEEIQSVFDRKQKSYNQLDWACLLI